MTEKADFIFPSGVLICPICAQELSSFHCHGCNSEFFPLGEIPCVFTTGIQQKNLWQHQMAMMETQGADALEHLDYILQGYDVSPRSRERLEQAYDAMKESLEMIMGLLKDGGLRSQRSELFEKMTVDNPTEYYHHILRDWAWDAEPSKHFKTHVNDANLQRVLGIWPELQPEKMLFLGAGAGRLSWDLHKTFKPQYTIASDINPFLLICAQTLIKRRHSITLPELYTYPQIGYPYSKSWVMNPPDDPEGLHKNWFALGADVWNMPLKESSVDTIVTSWLLDVTGGDVKDLIAVIDYLLKPGGYWINTGPLLYSGQLSFELKYSAEEILDFAQMAGFEVEKQSVEEVAHMASPLNARYHHEQVFSFSARKRTEPRPVAKPGKTAEWLTPAWLVMHHQPVPQIDFQCEMGHDFIRNVLSLVDGKRSIYLIAQLVQPTLPPGVDAKEAVVALFGQILEQMADAPEKE
ncbi:methyltransferase domain-containing protein [Saccharophagus sp. K07]|uniref:methyltransferase domain-containing protein n=1 Tax=Saccharophagus sp. K07 TaxID=2283636 RepID=UPI001651CA8A|nr:methyltransferase domain-containing protein [Saccharophagus sp. K07]MBC6904555.1 methyltransferase domain-containing protein [Saccharophagus sp. K07]